MWLQRTYKEGFSELRDIKKEIEHLHKLLEHNGAQLQVFFSFPLSNSQPDNNLFYKKEFPCMTLPSLRKHAAARPQQVQTICN